MLLQRLITALILIPLVILVVYKGSPLVYELLLGLVLVYAAWEWTLLMGIADYQWRIVYVLFIALLIATVAYLNIFIVLTVTLITWLIIVYWICRYPAGRSAWANNTVSAILGVMVLVPCWYALATLRTPSHGASLVMFLLVLVWTVDSGAYFSGRAWGKHKLAEQVSPGKTIEGVIGGLVGALLIGGIGIWWFALAAHKWPLWFLLILLTALASVLGDLLESMMKRNRGVKDCSDILPGHGGVLDRIDSLTAAAPIFVLGLLLFGV